ncbi:ferredoxin reductase [Paenibacillaceae bacterium]|nr:ferredoxin reductase [Paenibacillaceae bacterium]
MSDRAMVIVGAGEAGYRAAAELRSQGWAGGITLIGQEREYPYERPPLSKEVLTQGGEPVPVSITSADVLAQFNIRLISGTAAARIDRTGHIVYLATGEQVPYERLLLATGAVPRVLSVSGSGTGGALYLRRFSDAVAIRERLQSGKRIAIIGGGFIGLEVAASAIARGCRVELIEAAPRILMRGVPEAIGEIVEARHRKAGVEFRIGSAIERIERDGEQYIIWLANGTNSVCDTLIAGVGAVPDTALAEASGLEIDNGIKVNELLMTSDPDIFAAGDCCSFPHPLYGGRRIRLESWRNAQDQGLHAAGNMLGAFTPYASIPWFWSDQYEQTLQVAGLSEGADRVVIRDLGETGKLYFHLAPEGRLLAVSGIGAGGALSKEIRLAERLIEKQAVPDPEQLADSGHRLKDLLRVNN